MFCSLLWLYNVNFNSSLYVTLSKSLLTPRLCLDFLPLSKSITSDLSQLEPPLRKEDKV